MNGYKLAIKDNLYAEGDACAVCGRDTDPVIGPEFFMADSWALVCHDCGEEHAPALVRILQLVRSAEETTFAIFPWLGAGFPEEEALHSEATTEPGSE